jgi:hypothetical protein
MTTFAINSVYSFNTKAPALLGSLIQNAKLIGMLTYALAITYDNIDLKYRAIYPLLPPGSPDQPDSCIYYHFISESGERIILADQWINMSSIELIEQINFNVSFNQASIEDISRVRDALNSLGYTNFIIKQL